MPEEKIQKVGEIARVVQFFKLPRTGDIPVGFYGELLASRDGKHLWGREHSSWYQISLYKTITNKYIVAIGYRGKEEYENHDDVLEASDLEDVVMQLREYDKDHALLITFRPLISRLADDLGLVEVIDLPSTKEGRE